MHSALTKARWRLLPLLALGYLIAFMDRANLSFAAESMNRQLHFTPAIYGFGAGLFFLGSAAFEMPSNSLLLRVGARRWLARIMFTWGLIAIAMIFIHSTRSFYVMRLLLGIAEAGYFPGVLFYLSRWFSETHRARAIALFYISFPLGNTVMGALSGPLLYLDGRMGLHGWQWIFLVEGIPALVLSVVLWLRLPDGPEDATFLTHTERSALLAEVQPTPPRAIAGLRAHWEVFREPRVWVLAFFFFCMLGSSYALTFFLPQLLRGATGWTIGQIGLLIAVTGLVAAIAMLANAAHSDRTGERRWHICIPVLLMSALLFAASQHSTGWLPAACLMGYTVLYSSFQAPLMTLLTRSRSARSGAIAIAMINTCGISGGFFGPYLVGWLLERGGTYATALLTLSIVWLIAQFAIIAFTAILKRDSAALA